MHELIELLKLPIVILSIGLGVGFANHGFKLIEVHKHYHSKEKSKEE